MLCIEFHAAHMKYRAGVAYIQSTSVNNVHAIKLKALEHDYYVILATGL